MLENMSLRCKLTLVLVLTLLGCLTLGYVALKSVDRLASTAAKTIEVSDQLKELQTLQVRVFDFERTSSFSDNRSLDDIEQGLSVLVQGQTEAIILLNNLTRIAPLSENIAALQQSYQHYIDSQQRLIMLHRELGTAPDQGLRGSLSVVSLELSSKLMGALKPLYRDVELVASRFFDLLDERQHEAFLKNITRLQQKTEELNLTDFYQPKIDAYQESFGDGADVVFKIRDEKLGAQKELEIIRESMQSVTQYLGVEVLQTSEDEMIEAVVAARVKVVAGSSLLAIILILLLFNIARTVSTSLNRTISGLEGIGSGNLEQRLPINRKRSDEFDQVANAVNRMADELEDIVGEVIHSSAELNETATVLHTSIEQISQTTDQAAEQAASVASATEQMSVTLQDLVSTTNQADRVAEQSTRTSTEGAEIINRAVRSLADTVSLFTQIDQEVRELDQRSSRVDTITDMITDIAHQTNLLALNAAIEAARAGDAGRGFSVVADEVRGLAEKTVSATSEIGSTVEAMRSKIVSLLAIMEEGQQLVSTGRLQGEEALVMVSVINDNIKEATSRNYQISVGIEEMAQVTQDISMNMDGIADAMVQSRQLMLEVREKSVQVASKGKELTASGERFDLAV